MSWRTVPSLKQNLTDKKLISIFTMLCCLVYFVSYLTRLNYAAGLAATSLCNLAVYFIHSVWFLTLFWCINGFFQSMLWPPLVRIMAETLDEINYQKCCMKVSIAASIGTIAVYLFVPACITFTNWCAIFLLPACAGLFIAVIWIMGISSSDKISTKKQLEPNKTDSGFLPASQLKSVIQTAALPLIAAACILHGTLRDGITTWMPAYIIETFHISPSYSILTTSLLPVFSILSISLASFLCGYRRNEVKLSAGFFACCSLFLCILLPFHQSSPAISVAMMTMATGCMHGINLMLIGRLPRYFRNYGKVSTISGALNAATYVGSALSTYVFAALSSLFGWKATIIVWLGIALAGLAFCLSASKKWNRFCKSHSTPHSNQA